MASITKAELLERVADEAGVSKSQAEGVLSAFFSACTTAATSGDKVSWPGFGSFSASHRGARTGRNPRTGEPVSIAASTGMKFTASSTLKTALNAKKGGGAKKASAKKAPAKKAAKKR